MNLQFNTNPSFLSSRLFSPDHPRIGANTYLNVNTLPDFVEFIKRNLTSEELVALSEYQLQTYIMELSIKQKVTDSLDSFVTKILGHLRGRKQFWTNGKVLRNKENEEKQKQQQRHQHEAIVQYQKDIGIIGEKIPEYPQKVYNNIKKQKIQPFLQTLTTDFHDKEKQVLKVNFTNYSMMAAFVLQEYLMEEENIKALPKYEQLTKDQLTLLHGLENSIEFFLMQQKPKKNTNQHTMRRQLVRQRRLPAYLIDNCKGDFVEKEKMVEEIQDSIESNSREFNPIRQVLNVDAAGKATILALKDQGQQINIEQKESESQQQSSSDEQNEFYHSFHSQVSKKPFYDSKMFNKEVSINQSHNIMQILRCLVYVNNGKDNAWFERRWRQLQAQRLMRAKRKQEEQENEQEEESENSKQINQEKSNNNQGQQQKYKQNQIEQKIVHNQPQEKQKSGDKIELEDEENSVKGQKLQSKQQLIEIGVPKPVFDSSWRNPLSWSFTKLFKHLSTRFLSLRQVYFVTKEYINRNLMTEFNKQKNHFIQKQAQSKSIETALIDPQINLDEILLEFKEMIQHPENIKLGAFKTQGITIPWDETDYLLFLKGLLEFFFIPTNNRKIAQYMMTKIHKKTIEANHVKYVKAIYLKNMQVRIDRGQSGGGKKGRMTGKTEFIEKDVELFSMKWFDKIKKSKKKIRRRRFDDEDAPEEADSAY